METVRGILQRGKSHLSQHGDLEQGQSSRTSQMPTEDTLPTLISPTERLMTFRLLVGITTDRSLATSLFSSGHRPAPNVGIYTRICQSEQAAGRNYRWFSLLINFCLALQLIVAAALTALGASLGATTNNDPNNPSSGGRTNTNSNGVTALGAINTVIAGFLTYLKGSGLPGRFKYYHNEWKRIREAIEQRERELSRPDCTLDVYQVVAAVETMYEEVCQDIEASVPDSFHSPAKSHRDRAGPSPLSAAALKGLPDKFTETQPASSSYVAKLKDLESRYGAVVQETVAKAAHTTKQTGQKVEDTTATLREVEAEVNNTGRQVHNAVNEVEEFARRRLGLGHDDKDHKGEGSKDPEKL